MNKTKKIIAVVLVACLAFAFAGCGKQKASDAIDQAVKAVKEMDTEKMALYYGETVTSDLGDQTLYTSDVVEALTKNLTYKIISVDTNGDQATAQVEFTNANMSVVFTNFFMQVLADAFSSDLSSMSEEEINARYTNMLIEQLNADDVTLITTTATINLTYDADKKVWVIDSDSMTDMVNAMFGGIYDAGDSRGF
jgi:uncharacterized lipoprotein YehR (DUF1307 family)